MGSPARAEKLCWPWQAQPKPITHVAAPKPPAWTPVHIRRYRISTPIAPVQWKCSSYDAPDQYIVVIEIQNPDVDLPPTSDAATRVPLREPSKFVGAAPIQVNLPLVRQFDPRDVVSAVPEPAIWTQMLLGFAGIGYVVRRRRTARIT
jgi:hypothetical protein